MATESADQMLGGRLFQSLGAVTGNVRSPFVFSLDFGTASKSWSDNRKGVTVGEDINNSDIYLGAKLYKALHVINEILKIILNLTGSQGSEAKIGGICS